MPASTAKRHDCPNCGRAIFGQRNYVLHLLEESGREGVTTNEFLAWGAGNRFGARIHDLRHEDGLNIIEHNELYVLHPPVAGQGAVETRKRGGKATVRVGYETMDPYGFTREWVCRTCGVTTDGPHCSLGHEATVGWLLNTTDPKAQARLAEFLAQDDLAVAA